MAQYVNCIVIGMDGQTEAEFLANTLAAGISLIFIMPEIATQNIECRQEITLNDMSVFLLFIGLALGCFPYTATRYASAIIGCLSLGFPITNTVRYIRLSNDIEEADSRQLFHKGHRRKRKVPQIISSGIDGVLKRTSMVGNRAQSVREFQGDLKDGGSDIADPKVKLDKKKQNATLISFFDEADRVNDNHINNSWDNPDGIYYDMQEGVIRVGPKHFDIQSAKGKSPVPSESPSARRLGKFSSSRF